ncbi:MAG: S1C family serine protease [Thermoleophilaceae bacterium]
MARLLKLRISLFTAFAAVLGLGLALFFVGANRDGSNTPTVAAVSPSNSNVSAAQPVASGSSPESVYKAVHEGVVSIVSTTTSQSNASPGFGQTGNSSALGSGIVLDNNGDILTNDHVVDGANKLTVSFDTKPSITRTATVVGTDPSTDLAVIKIDPSGLSLDTVSLGSSSSVQVGDKVYALGNPFGYTNSFSEGIVSGLNRSITSPNGFGIDGAIQTDASINPGNSGGPLLNANGQVVGINAQIATNNSTASGEGSSSGVGFAIPIDLAKNVVAQLEQSGHVSHAYLGVSTGSVSGSNPGAQVASVQPGSPADKAGIQAGDVIQAVGGTKVSTSDDVASAIGQYKPGDKVAVTVHRSSGQMTLSVTLGTQPSQAPNNG